MKKFNPQREIKKNKKKKIIDSSVINNAFIIMLVMACICLAIVGYAFSYRLSLDEEVYSIDVETYYGEEVESHHFESKAGGFKVTLNTKGILNGIECDSGYVEYDDFTQTLSIPYLNKNTKCDVYFRDEVGKYLSLEGMYSINDNDGVSYYYPGDATNNYLKFKDLMFRIVRVNGDGTLRLLLDDSSLVSSFGTNNNYNASNVKSVLNEWFNSYIGNSELVALEYYDISNYAEIDDSSLVNLDTSMEMKVGLLDAREANLIIKSGKGNYIGNTILINGTKKGMVFAVGEYGVTSINPSEEYTIKPVINIKDVDMDGFGTLDNPYLPKED